MLRNRTAIIGCIAVVMLVPRATSITGHHKTAESRSITKSDVIPVAWWSQVQQELASYEYRPSETGEGLQAPNRAHDLRTYFDASGIRVHGRTSSQSAELLRLALVAMGRADAANAVPAGIVHQTDDRVEIHRPEVTEWFENSAQGLEQGFTIRERQRGNGPLIIDLGVSQARARLAGDFVELATNAGRKLRYGKLLAQDSTGRELGSRLAVPSPDRIRLIIEDADAIYPLLIDPLLTGQPDQRLESNRPDPPGVNPVAFGASVHGAGDVNGDGFDDVIVGAPGWDGGVIHEGAAFVFLGSAAGIVGTDPSNANAHIESNQGLAQLGAAVSGAGDVNGDGYDDIIVGAPEYESTLPGTQLAVHGAAFVFLGGPGGITGRDPATAHARILADQLRTDLGQTVSSAGDVNGDGFGDVIVGAPDHGHAFPPDSNIPPNERSGSAGAALVFHGSAAGIVGTGFPDADAVILPYEPSNLEDPVELAQFSQVAGAGDVNGDGFDDVLIGGTDVWLFVGGPAGIVGRDPTAAQSRISQDPTSDAWFTPNAAGDVNADGFDDIVVGTPTRDLVQFSRNQEGAAYVFLGAPGGIFGSRPADAHASFFGSLLAEWVGGSVAGAGDVDRDGFADVLVAARVYPGSLDNEGVAYLFRGSPSGITANTLLDADVRIEARQSGAVVLENESAFSVTSAGDVNGDGFTDVIMGKGYYDAGELNEGAAFLYFGGPWPTNPNQPPVARAGADKLVYDTNADGSESISVDGRASFDPDGTIVSFAWYEGETLLGTSPVLTTNLPTTGDHTLVLTVTDDDGVTRGDPVTIRVDQVTEQRVFLDTFSSGLGGWIRNGDVVLSSADSFPTAPQARIGASGAFMRRTVAVPAGTSGVTLDFWAKASGFSDGDELLVKVSADGGPFTTIRTFTVADSTDGYVFYGGSAIPFGHSWYPTTVSSVVVEFESRMATGHFFFDDIRVNALIVPEGGTGGGTNQAPIADAGPDQTVTDVDGSGTETITLTGSGSDPDGTIVSYEWRNGATLIGHGSSVNASLAVGVHTLALLVTDDGGASGSDTVTIAVEERQPANQAPVADAGPDQTLTDADGDGTEVVTFDGTGSTDPDGTIASYFWRKDGNLFNNVATFSVRQPVGTHAIELTVTDDQGATSTDTVLIIIGQAAPPPDNQAPVADAGADQTVTANSDGIASVLLDGTASFDPDGEISGYGWYENGVQIASSFGVGVPLTVGVHTITLKVTDNFGAVDTDDVVVTVNAAETAPAEPEGSLSISGPTSPERGDSVTFTITLTNTGSATIVDVQLTLAVSPSDRFKDLSPGGTVSVGSVAPGATVRSTWKARANREGSATVTAAASSGGTAFATATHSLTIRK